MSKFEELQAWLTREEEVAEVGVAKLVMASTDIEEARLLLFRELGYWPGEIQLDAFFGALQERYSAMPEIGVVAERVWQPKWEGWQYTFRSTVAPTKGQFVSRSYVQQAIKELYE